MNRRELPARALAAASLLGIGGVFSLLPAHAQARKFENGTDFISLDKPVAVESPPDKVEVVEFFWYACPHCHAFEPRLETWLKVLPRDVSFRRVPVAFRDTFAPQQRLYYALEALGRAEEFQTRIFTAIHVQKIALDTQETIAPWVEKQGIDKAKFLELYNSFGISTKARKAKQLQDMYRIDGVPSLGIAGRYYTDGTLAKNMDRALQVTEFLITEARRTKA